MRKSGIVARMDSRSPLLYVKLGVALTLAIVLGWRIIQHGVSDMFANADPAVSLDWESDSPGALSILAQRALAQPDLASATMAANYATELLQHDPLASSALSSYALAQSRLGTARDVKEMMLLASRHSPLDLVSHAWLYDDALQSGDILTALTELDMLLRTRPTVAKHIGATILPLMGRNSASQAGFVKLLASGPPWRTQLLNYLANNVDDTVGLKRLFNSLQLSSAPPTEEEIKPFLERLLRVGDLDGAYLAWLKTLSSAQIQDMGLLYNGRFQYEMTNMPFDWQISSSSSVSAQVVRTERSPVLKLEFFGDESASFNVSHLITLPPGQFVFAGTAETQDLRAERGLRWRVYCASGDQQTLSAGEPLTLKQGTINFKIELTIPNDNCATQALILEIPARSNFERRLFGSVAYSNLEILEISSPNGR